MFDDLRQREVLVDTARSEAVQAVRALSDGAVVDANRSSTRRALRKLRANSVPDADPELAAAAPAFDTLRDMQASLQTARAAAWALHAKDMARLSARLREVAGDTRFREAVLWQNRGAVSSALDRVRDAHVERPTKHREHEQLVVRYLQRYCTKNESIGFFGPVGWGALSSETRVEPGPTLVASADVYFEHWAIDTLARTLASDEAMRRELAPRLLPTVSVDDTRIRYGTRGVQDAPGIVTRLLAMCDGETSARSIAGRLLAEREAELESESDVYDLLQELEEQRLVTWTLEVPSGIARPDDALLALLSKLPATDVRERAVTTVQRLRQAKARVRGAFGDPEELDVALTALNETFRELSGVEPVRRSGEMYAARSLVYLDCRRDLELQFGPGIQENLRGGLLPILQSARWYTFEIARRYHALAVRIYREMVGEIGKSVPYLQFWERMAPHFPEQQWQRSSIVAEVVELLEAHWRDVLRLSEGHRRVQLDSAVLGTLLERLRVPGPGWPVARHLSPDILICARNVEALQRGDCTFVLGELHIGNTMISNAFLEQSPEPDALLRAHSHDLVTRCVAPVEAKELATRADRVPRLPDDFHLELGHSRSWRPREQVLRAADLVIQEHDNVLEVIDPARGHRFDVIAFLEQYLTFATSSHFKLAPHGGYRPRVTIDRFVVMREQWVLQASDFAFVGATTPELRFEGARKWARSHDFPRWVFAKAPHERKPIYVDFDSPHLVELLAKVLRQATEVTITEMLPAPMEAWLPDAQGQSYTSEIRMVAVDALTWRPTPVSRPT
jgi:hypothetical protein